MRLTLKQARAALLEWRPVYAEALQSGQVRRVRVKAIHIHRSSAVIEAVDPPGLMAPRDMVTFYSA